VLLSEMASGVLQIHVDWPLRKYEMYMNSVFGTRMWAKAQRDGRPAKHRLRPLFNAAIWLTPTIECGAVTLPRSETR